MSRHARRVVILFSLLIYISVLTINSYGQGGSATKTPPPPSTKQPTKSNKPVKRSTASHKTRQATKANDSKSIEVSYWESIKNSTNLDDFRAYLNKYPNGEFVDLAKNKISSLEAAAKDKAEQERAERERREAEDKRKAEIAYWESMKNSTNQEDFREYLRKYPNGEFADLAKNRISTLENEARERESAARAQRENEAWERESTARAQRIAAMRARMRGMTQESIYKGFLDNRNSAPELAYAYAKEYLERYASDNDRIVDYLHKWVSSYEDIINRAKPK